jgi:polyhydroxyalkanoate synthase
VVFQNDLIQLLQFAPATDEVKKRPLLVVPPWINKYYILDLRKHNSFVRWAVEQGHTVFVISWVNPDRRHADKGFDSYVEEGLIGAVDAIEAQTGEREVNAVGYCLGGTLLGVGLAYMAAIGDKRIASATFFTSMLDFADPGDLGVFIDENSVSALERKMNERGYLDGSEMASAFSKMRANELIWSFAVNNYMLGRDPVPFDLLFWNADSTRMPARMHSFYLRNMYLHNRLTEPGGIKIMGQPIDLGKIKVPCYFVSALEDHIAPWKSTFSGARLMGGPVRFVLGGSGHIAGIVNPPADNKYCFWLNESKEADADKWLTEAQRHPGSWWTDWAAWVSGLNSETAPARDPEHGVFAPIEDAPGSYASVRLDEGQKR